MKNIEFSDVRITGGYWKYRQQINKDITLGAVYERFVKTHRFEALECKWKPGMPNEPHLYWDSDVAKWLEAAAYTLSYERNDEIAAIIENAVDCIVTNSDENGYFNSHYLVSHKEDRFKDRNCHELYCAGHLFEAAAAYYTATGNKRFLECMCKYADYIERVFKAEKSAAFSTPGHPELELALMRLYKATGEQRYAELAKYFIDEHGKHGIDGMPSFVNECFNQDEMPLCDRETAEGHCVRSLYLLCGAADVAAYYGDEKLRQACDRCFDNIANRRMYITGGVGSTNIGEAFSVDYYLPNRTAYAETCASIALYMFANRMLAFGANAKYGDIAEKALYNGIMSGVSQDGKSFFYENPLEIDADFNNINTSTNTKERFPITQRVELFDCSCCPPNILRTLASLSGCIYGFDDDTVYVHQYIDSEADTSGIHIIQKTDFPKDGRVSIICNCRQSRLALRIPGWCRKFKASRDYTVKDGYAYIELKGDDVVDVELDMSVHFVAANRRVHDDSGRVAVMRGPVVYCAEGVDNGADVKSVLVNINEPVELYEGEFELPSLKLNAYRPRECDSLYYDAHNDYEEIPLVLIPYCAFANRGTTEMQVWLLRKN